MKKSSEILYLVVAEAKDEAKLYNVCALRYRKNALRLRKKLNASAGAGLHYRILEMEVRDARPGH